MILKLDDNYRINCDEYNFILQKKKDPRKRPRMWKDKKVKKSGTWEAVGYWKDLSPLLLDYSRLKIRSSRVGTLKELSAFLTSLTLEIKAIGERCESLWGKTL